MSDVSSVSSRLVSDEVREAIRRAYVPGVFGFKAVAKRFGVSPSTVRRIINPERAERDRQLSRAAKRRRTGTCRECGGVTRYNGQHGKAVSDLCKNCNNALAVRCGRGHLLTPEIRLNSRIHGHCCRICRNETHREWSYKKRREQGVPERGPYQRRRLVLVDGEGRSGL